MVEHDEKMTIKINRFESNGRVQQLNRPLFAESTRDDGYWIYEIESLGLVGGGNTCRQALSSLHEDFFDTWDNIVDEDPNKLDGKAQELRETLLSLTHQASSV